MQNKLEQGRLLNDEGCLIDSGYATSLIKTYSKEDIKAKKSKIKEWDYYYIGNSKYGVSLMIAAGFNNLLCTISFFDFENSKVVTNSKTKRSKNICLPSTSESGETFFESNNVEMRFIVEDGKRHLISSFKEFGENKEDLRLDLYLDQTNKDSIVTAEPFNKPGTFIYSQKINILRSSGYVKFGDKIFDFNKDTYGVLNWCRSVLIGKATWLWSSLSAAYEGKRIGFNLGSGFGKSDFCTENMFFYDNKSYKLEDVHFDITYDKLGNDSYLEPWRIRSISGDISLTFTPILNNHFKINKFFNEINSNQVFGTFSGYILVEEKEYFFTDVLGFVQKVRIK